MGSINESTSSEGVVVENPALGLMMRQAFPDLAAALRQRAGRILDRFRVMAKEVLPSADELTLNEILDHLPQALADLATALARTGGPGQRNFLGDSREHGVCRYHQSFNLGELLVEYSILRSIVFEEAAVGLGRPLNPEEISGLNAGFDAVGARAVESFVRFQQHEVQEIAESQSKHLSFLSHDLRGSLNGILLMLELLRRELGRVPQFQKSLDDMDLMRRSILDTVGTMDRFLHAERFRRGKVEAKLTEVDLAATVAEAVNQFSHQAQEKGVEIVTDISHCRTIVTDRELVALILQNLVSNAVKYSALGPVRVGSEPVAAGGCRLSVADCGPGISPEQMRAIFQPFVRGATHGQSGTGLGLFIASQAASLLNARLWAESEGAGSGSTFFLELAGPQAPQI